MGALDALMGQRVYLDANIIIYAVEDVPQFSPLIGALVAAIDGGQCSAVTSELSLAECLVKPNQDRRPDIAKVYLRAFEHRQWFSTAPIDRPTLVEAASVRAASGLRLPDAIHVATARLTQCTVFLTNDRALTAASGVNVALLSGFTSG